MKSYLGVLIESLFALVIVFLLVFLFLPPISAHAQDQQVINHELIVDSGGSINFRSGAALKIRDVAVTADAADIDRVVDNFPASGGILLSTNAAPINSVASTGTVTFSASVVVANGETVTINDQTYTFVTGDLDAANKIKIVAAGAVAGNTNSITATNLLLAITVGGTNNPTLYATNTVTPTGVTGSSGGISAVALASAAYYHGTLGNSMPFTRAGAATTNLTVTGTGTLSGGVDGTPGDIGQVYLHGTGLSFTTILSATNYAVWTTK